MSSKSQSLGWSGRFAFILACVGSAVGLGNIWKFPYITFENGGGGFVLVYLLAIAAIGLPVLIAEIVLGQLGQDNLYGTVKKLKKRFGNASLAFAAMSVFSCFVILSFYSVVAGWTLNYFWLAVQGMQQFGTIESANAYFGSFVGDASSQLLFHSLFMFLTAIILWWGTAGIERAVKVLLPCLFVLIVVIVWLNASTYSLSPTLEYLFRLDFSKLSGPGLLEAVGHAFFTLSLGMGIMVVYGSYLSSEYSVLKLGLWIAVLDTLVALLACLMIFPILLHADIPVSASVAILFTSLSYQLAQVEGGSVLAALFFLLVAFAALSSTISLLEPVVSFVRRQFSLGRKTAVIFSGISVWVLGVFSALSNGAVNAFTELKVMDRLDYLTSSWTLPLGGLFIALFAGWAVRPDQMAKFLQINKDSLALKGLYFFLRWPSPVLIIVVILAKIS